MNRTASRRGFLKTGALAGTGLAALAASGCKGEPAEEQEPSKEPAVKAAGYAYDRVRAVMDGQVAVEGAGVDFHVEDIYTLNKYAFGPERKYEVTELGLIPYVSKYINEDFRAYTLVPFDTAIAGERRLMP